MEENRSYVIPEDSDGGAVWATMPSIPSRHLGTVPNTETCFRDLTGMFFMVSLNVLALLANTAVLVVIIKAPHLRKFTFVCHLCAVDLLCALFLMPFGIVCSSVYFSGVMFTVLECQVYNFLNVVLIAASIFTITAISVERYYYIVHPMRYEVKMTLKLTAVVMMMVWLLAAGLGLCTVIGWPPYGSLSSISAAHCSLHWSHGGHKHVFSAIFCIVCFCLPALVIFAMYCSVYKVARVAACQRGPLPSWSNSQLKHRSDSINSQTTIITTRNTPCRITRERFFGGDKAALTLVVIVGQFLICWLPYFAFYLHLTLDPTPELSDDLWKVITWLAYSSFAVNPFFYGLLNRQIREELCKLRCCNSARPVEMPISSHEGQENFLQFLHRTSCTVETHMSCATSTTQNALDQTGIPGQIPEEFS
ncbi:probable G-protein coupled receptor [Thalassophryne amazonica]|uniref:probable G-protein coupled receptor n=1 Tax=Thalassophryne amazonica TaxID=390379 RepID=UPI001471FC99|nr:probable G-protein coupled receptor [Thalassophryne amazonica]XP_034022259.1 probable G-protein coupled receptor [Thalassophryne amazonica]